MLEHMLKRILALARSLKSRLRALWVSGPAAMPGSRVAVPVRIALDLLRRKGTVRKGGTWSYLAGSRSSRRPAAPPAPRRAAGPGAGLRLGEQLVAGGFITLHQLEEALMRHRISGRRLGQTLVEMRLVTERDVAAALAVQRRSTFIDLSNHVIDPAVAKLVPEHIARRHQLIPINKVGPNLTVAMVDPLNVLALDDIGLMTGLSVRSVVATATGVQRALEDTYGAQSQLDKVFGDIEGDIARDAAGREDLEAFGELGENDAPIIRLVNLILTQAVGMGCSDIQIEPFERELRVRFRRDGRLRTEMTPPKKAQAAILQRILVLASIGPGRRSQPRTGQIQLRVNNRSVDLNVALQPSRYGELISLHVNGALARATDALGMGAAARQRLVEALRLRSGLIVLAGPQRSGRSTTLYSVARELNGATLDILMVEESPRAVLHGVNQCACRPGSRGGYARALRSVRQLRPDVLILGDVPDRAAASLVLDALDAGILVIARLHGASAAAAIDRLRDLSGRRRDLARHLRLVVTQRLVRTLCGECRTGWEPPRHLVQELGMTPEFLERASVLDLDPLRLRFLRAQGCDRCFREGYSGQTGIFEVMPISPRNRRAIESDRPAAEICRVAMEEGLTPFREEALRKVLQGVTSLEEVHDLDRLPGHHGSRPDGPDDLLPARLAEATPVLPAVSADSAPPAAHRPPDASLVVRQGVRVAGRFWLKAGDNTIGVRDMMAGIVPDIDLEEFDAVGLVSPFHARVIQEGPRLWVIDELGSTGTQLNGRHLPRALRVAVQPGDALTLAGGLTLTIESAQARPLEPGEPGPGGPTSSQTVRR